MNKGSKRGFTLIELLVVVAIIALLVSILLPSLAMARAQGKAVKCGANLKNVGVAMTFYTSDYSVYPASYLYPLDEDAHWNPKNQPQVSPHNPKFGYLHWSYFLYSGGKIKDEAFECPALQNGGCPRTDPGPDDSNWEVGDSQKDKDGNSFDSSSKLLDKQAPRMAYTCNAAIVTRNKFTTELSGGQRINKFVGDNKITTPGKTILATEYHKNWKTAASTDGICKAHRPIQAFYNLSARGDAEYQDVNTNYTYERPFTGTVTDAGLQLYGLMGTEELEKAASASPPPGILTEDTGMSQLNAVGRHHPGGDGKYYGTANFLYCDGHVERQGILDTMQNHLWGDTYWSMTGINGVTWGTRINDAVN